MNHKEEVIAKKDEELAGFDQTSHEEVTSLESDEVAIVDSDANDSKKSDVGRLFTQSELDDIIKRRLTKAKATMADYEEREKQIAAREEDLKNKEEELTKRQKELDYRENLEKCKTYLKENSLPEELLDIISPEESDKFISTVEKLGTVFSSVSFGVPAPLASTDSPLSRSPLIGFSRDYERTPKSPFSDND